MERYFAQEYRKNIAYYGFCDHWMDIVEITGILILRQSVGGQFWFTYPKAECEHSEECPVKGNCIAVKQADRKWHEEANEEIKAMQ